MPNMVPLGKPVMAQKLKGWKELRSQVHALLG